MKFQTIEACNSRSSGQITLGQKLVLDFIHVNNMSKANSYAFRTHPAFRLEKKADRWTTYTWPSWPPNGAGALRHQKGQVNNIALTSHCQVIVSREY